MHRLRALRRCVPRPLHLRPRRRQRPEDPTSPGERFGFVYEINYLRCIHCDLCVEACPTEAITETKLFEFAFTNRDDAIYTKDELLVGETTAAARAALGELGRRRPARSGLDAPAARPPLRGRRRLVRRELGYGVRPRGR